MLRPFFRSFLLGKKKSVIPDSLLPGIGDEILPETLTQKFKSKTDMLKQRQRTRREMYKVKPGSFPIE